MRRGHHIVVVIRRRHPLRRRGPKLTREVFQSHRISQIERIVVAVAEEVVVAGVEERGVFAGEAAEAGVIVRAGLFLI